MIQEISVKKLESGDPRYPNQTDPPFSSVYRLHSIMEDGSEREAAFFVFDDMTPAYASSMLKVFAKAIES